jgi:MFS superfamily sulfate permease-like transporter
MGNRLSAAFALAIIAVFLGFYAVKIASIPLTIIIVAVLAMVVTDFVQSVRESRNRDRSKNGDSRVTR